MPLDTIIVVCFVLAAIISVIYLNKKGKSGKQSD